MIEMYGVTDYGRYSYNREAEGRRGNADIAFDDIMAGSGEASGDHETTPLRFDRKTEYAVESFLDEIVYNSGGRMYVINSNLGVNLDIVI